MSYKDDEREWAKVAEQRRTKGPKMTPEELKAFVAKWKRNAELREIFG